MVLRYKFETSGLYPSKVHLIPGFRETGFAQNCILQQFSWPWVTSQFSANKMVDNRASAKVNQGMTDYYKQQQQKQGKF